jgi:endoglucanase
MQLTPSRWRTSPALIAVALFSFACNDALGPGLASAAGAVAAGNPLGSLSLYVDPASSAKKTADAWRPTRPADAALMEKMAAQPQALWFGNWNSDLRGDVDRAVGTAASAEAVPVLVAYNIPQRDCGGYSAGGSDSPDGYRAWIRDFAAGIGRRRAVVILEPDALPGMDCLSSSDQQMRTALLREAVQTLTTLGGTTVYLDAGHSRWQSASTMATRLAAAGIELASGFSLNVSNFHYTSEQIAYGNTISRDVGDKHYVIDTSRNGLGPTSDADWCNPDGRALGERPTAGTGNSLVDAFLWVKRPGESDGDCNGNPPAGTWMPEYALDLAKRAGL